MALFFREGDPMAAADGALLIAIVLQGFKPELQLVPVDEDEGEDVG